MNTPEYRQVSLYNYFYLIFPLEHWCLVLPQVSRLCSLSFMVTQFWVWVTSHGICHKSNQTLIGYFHELRAAIALVYFVGMSTLLKIQRFGAGLVFMFVFWWPAEHLLLPKTLRHRDEGTMQAPSQLSMFMELCGCSCESWGLAVRFWRATHSPVNSLGNLENSIGHLRLRTQMEYPFHSTGSFL